MTGTTYPHPIVSIREMSVDEVDSGLPVLSLTDVNTGETRRYGLAPDAVRGIVDALLGVAEPAPGEFRIVAKCNAKTLGAVLLHLNRTGDPEAE